MRIGLFSDTYTPEINGVVTSIVTLQKELERNGHTVFVVTTANSALHIQKDGNILRMPGVEIKKLYGYRMASPFQVTGLFDVKQMKLDIIHVHTEFGIGIFARIVGRLLSIPIVSTYHTTYEDYTHYVNVVQSKTLDIGLKRIVSSLSKLYGDSCHTLISPSEKTKTMLEGYGIKREIHVIPTGVDLSRFDASLFDQKRLIELRETHGVSQDKLMLLFVGRIAQEKSIDMIIRAMQQVKEANLPVRAVIVGGGPDLAALQEVAQELNVADWISFTGKLSSQEVPQYYLASDLFVSASLTETQGLTFIEAMAGGSIVFAREREIMADLIQEGKTGFYFDDEHDLCNQIKRLLVLNEAERKQISEQAKQAVAQLDSKIFYQNIMRVYERAIHQYRDMYHIKGYKAKQGNFELTLENDVDTMKYLVSVETFYRHRIEVDQMAGPELIETFKRDDRWLRAYHGAMKFLTAKDRTRKEMYDYLSTKTDLPIEEMNTMIEKFEELNYINDERYVKQQVDRMKLMLNGKSKIIATLVKKGIPYERVEEALSQEEEGGELMRAVAALERLLTQTRGKNENNTRLTVFQKLMRQGFHQDVIQDAMSQVPIAKERQEELSLLQKEYEKQHKRLSRNYSGYELQQRLTSTMLRKGYDYQMLMEFVEEQKDEVNQ